MKHAFIMDPLERVKAHKDTTYFLMLAAQQRGHRVCFLPQRALRLEHNQVHARVTWLQVNEAHDNPFTPRAIGGGGGGGGEDAEQDCELGDMDVVWIRTDPPFDRAYFYTTLLLDYLPKRTRVVNRPSGLRNWNEKLAALCYADLTPKTLLSNEPTRIKQFSQRLAGGRITVKPLDGFGGQGIIFYSADSGDDAALAEITQHGRRWVIAQEYLPAARDGDKRVLLLNGEPLGAILRVHAEGKELNNMDAGGRAHAAELEADDRKICAALKPGLREQGVFFAGLDIIGGRLIEVNVTSPTGLQELCRFNRADYHHQIIAALE